MNSVPMVTDSETSEDAILGGRLRVRQPMRGHRVGHDAILLAAATGARTGEQAVDLGSGIGAAGLALAVRIPGLKVTLVEIDAILCALAAHNARLNRLADRVDVRALDAENLDDDAERPEARRPGECACGQEVTVLGRLRSVEYGPQDATATLEAELFDGTEGVTLIWLGRRRIPGIEPGRTMRVRGRIALREGRKVLYNPYYEICQAT